MTRYYYLIRKSWSGSGAPARYSGSMMHLTVYDNLQIYTTAICGEKCSQEEYLHRSEHERGARLCDKCAAIRDKKRPTPAEKQLTPEEARNWWMKKR